MPLLRKKNIIPQSSQEKSSSSSIPATDATSQNDKEPIGGGEGDSSNQDVPKIKQDRTETPDERPASPRRLRDRRLLAGFKPELPSNGQQVTTNSPNKTDNNSNSSGSPSKQAQATEHHHQQQSSTGHKSTPTKNRSQPTQPTAASTAQQQQQQQTSSRSSLKRPSLGRSESLLIKKQPKLSNVDLEASTSRVSIASMPQAPVTSTPMLKRANSCSSTASSSRNGDVETCNATTIDNLASTAIEQLGAINMTKSTSKIKTFNVLIGVTGSVAAIKLIEFIRKLRAAFPRSFTSVRDNQTYKATIAIKVIITENSKHFIPKEEIYRNCGTTSARLEVLEDSDEWAQWSRIGDPVLHIELRKWADICVIAPLDANTMAKLTAGICDNLLTCTVRAWDCSKPLIYCPAMNVHMYSHPITVEQLNKLESFGYLRVDCIEKRLACGDVGFGAMAAVDTIVTRVVDSLLEPISRANTNIRLPQQLIYGATNKPFRPDSVERSVSPINHHYQHQPSGINSPIAIGGAAAAVISPSNVVFTNGSSSNHRNPQQQQQHSFKKPHNNGHFSRAATTISAAATTSTQATIQKDLQHLINSGQTQNNRASNIVTSIQNLKAIDFDKLIRENSNNDLDEPDNERHGGNRFNYDPSSAMVQNLISKNMIGSVASSVVNNNVAQQQQQHISSSTSNPTNNHRNINNNVAAFKPKSSLRLPSVSTGPVDPSAFLVHCFNKSRNCFTCIICKNDYKNRKSMSRHLKEQHLQGNIHRCNLCGLSYKRREKLIKHNREHHNMVD